METTKLTIRLPKEDVDFAKRYAKDHGLTVTELIDRFLRQLQLQQSYPSPVHPEIDKITGLVPGDIDVREEYHQHAMEKHS